jgi:hypothetical protein
MQLEWAINQGFEIDHYQPLLFVVDSFDHPVQPGGSAGKVDAGGKG